VSIFIGFLDPAPGPHEDFATPEGSYNLIRRYNFLRLLTDGPVMPMPSFGSHDLPDIMRISRVL